MAQQSYKIKIEGEDTLLNVVVVLEFFYPDTINQASAQLWEGEVNDIDVQGNLDYEFLVLAGGSVDFKYKITNKANNNDVLDKEDKTGVKIPNAADIRGNCSPI